jgi:beta-galactosidase/beta-glucuronidase
VRCGFRDLRFQDGYFRLNGRRILLKSGQTDARSPIGIFVAHDPDLPRRDLFNGKVAGLNMIRSFGGETPHVQLDLCDELGLLVYQESCRVADGAVTGNAGTLPAGDPRHGSTRP